MKPSVEDLKKEIGLLQERKQQIDEAVQLVSASSREMDLLIDHKEILNKLIVVIKARIRLINSEED